MASNFLKKSFSLLFSTIHRTSCQNKKKVLQNFFETILEKFMKFVWLVFFHRPRLWNDMNTIFDLGSSTRVTYIPIAVIGSFILFVDVDFCLRHLNFNLCRT